MAAVALSRPISLRTAAGREPGRKVTWLELFFDLVFVAAVSSVGAPLTSDYSLEALGRCAFQFLLIWWAWYGHTTYATRFDNDDVPQRLLTLVQMFAAAAMAVNAKEALGSRDAAGFAAAYAVMRLVIVAQYARARRVPEARGFATTHAVGFGAAAVVWLASALTPAPLRFGLWAVALLIDLSTPFFATRHMVQAPPDAAHLPERFGLFTIILVGDAMVGVMRGMESQATWPLDAALSAFLGMTSVFLVWWCYFDGANATEERPVTSEAEARGLHVWTFTHVPLYLGILVVGVGIHHTVAVASRGHLHAAESWMLCGAFATVLFSIALLSGRHVRRSAVFAIVMLGVGALGPWLPCSVVMGAVALVLAAQIVVSGAVRRRV
jgi:low temperature requirement protein LtrA